MTPSGYCAQRVQGGKAKGRAVPWSLLPPGGPHWPSTGLRSPGLPKCSPRSCNAAYLESASFSAFLPQILLPWRTAQAFRVYYTQLCGSGPVCHLSKLPSSSVNDTCLMRPTKYITSMGPRNASCKLKALKALAKLSVSECPRGMPRLTLHFFLCSAGYDEGRGPQQARSPLLRHPTCLWPCRALTSQRSSFFSPAPARQTQIKSLIECPSLVLLICDLDCMQLYGTLSLEPVLLFTSVYCVLTLVWSCLDLQPCISAQVIPHRCPLLWWDHRPH